MSIASIDPDYGGVYDLKYIKRKQIYALCNSTDAILLRKTTKGFKKIKHMALGEKRRVFQRFNEQDIGVMNFNAFVKYKLQKTAIKAISLNERKPTNWDTLKIKGKV